MTRTTKRVTQQITLTNNELVAAFLACSNYTPPPGEKWKQKRQSQACAKLRYAMVQAGGWVSDELG